MKPYPIRAAVCGLLAAVCLYADFSYQERIEITGGTLAGMMKMMGRFSKQAGGPNITTFLVKGDRAATISGTTTTIIDLPSESMILVDMEKKQFSRISFAEMAAAMDKMQSQVRTKQNEAKTSSQAQIDYKISVDKTPETRQIAGVTAQKYLLKMQMNAKDQRSQGQVSLDTVSEIWLAPPVAGYQEVRAFYKRMAAKMAYDPRGGMFAGLSQMNPQAGESMRKAMEEISKLDGMPVRQVIHVGSSGQAPPAGSSAAPQTPTPQPKQDAAAGALGEAVAGRLGRLGGLGRFGRKPKKEEPKPDETTAAGPQAAPQGGAGSAPGSLMEVTSEIISFSQAPIDGSKLAVPSGFKEVEHPMKKMLKN